MKFKEFKSFGELENFVKETTPLPTPDASPKKKKAKGKNENKKQN